MLVLFDIDQTMISTSGAGRAAMELAGRDLFGDRFSARHINFAGSIDPIVVAQLFEYAGVANTVQNVAAFRRRYAARLHERLADPATGRTVLPGVLELLARLRAQDAVTLGVLSGNYGETGRAKLAACGIDPEWFRVSVWGDDAVGGYHGPGSAPCRDELPRVGLARYRELHGFDIESRRTVVVGDTPHDVRCALVNGCRSLAVATGAFDAAALAAAGAHRAVPDLSAVEDVLGWILSAG
ncbi:MAG: haloacid dehalogenase-like hydrolase [Phycisphaerae bacterium]|nr:haloacid dehalogenase-like hydrolase [Phycisphaerae bacterium]